MAVSYGFFDSVGGDRKYSAAEISQFYDSIVTNGVFQSFKGGLAVSAGTGLSVSVAAGRAIVQSRWILNDAALTLSIDAASTTYGRIDAVVIRLSESSRNISIVVKKGTPASSPVAPSLTRSGGTYEMALAYVTVAASASSVSVTDKRSNSSLCGWAAVRESVPGEIDAMLEAMKTGFDGVEYPSPAAMVQGCDQKLQNQIAAMAINDDSIYDLMSYAVVNPNTSSFTNTTNASKIFGVTYKKQLPAGKYFVKTNTASDITFYVFKLPSQESNSVTLISSVLVHPVNGVASALLTLENDCFIAFQGEIQYKAQSGYLSCEITVSSDVYTVSYWTGTLLFDLLIKVINDDDLEQSIYSVANESMNTTPIIEHSDNFTSSTDINKIFAVGGMCLPGVYSGKIYTSTPVEVFILGIDAETDTSLTEIARFSLYPEDGVATIDPIKVNHNFMFAFSGVLNYKNASAGQGVSFYNISYANGVYSKTSSVTGWLYTNIDFFKCSKVVGSGSSADGIGYIARATDTVKIKLIGDSITQGSGSTGYVEWTADGITYRGNAPDYPGAGSDYQVGDYLGSKANIRWYEAIDGQGWGQLMKAYFEAKFDCEVKDYGMGGATTADIISNWNNIISADDNIVIIMLGTNDRNNLTLSTYGNNLNTIVTSLLAMDKHVILMAPPALKITVDKLSTYFHMEDAANVTSAVAYDNGVQCIPLYTNLLIYCSATGTDYDSLLLSDGIHPNDSGYAVIFRLITESLGLFPKRIGATW